MERQLVGEGGNRRVDPTVTRVHGCGVHDGPVSPVV